MARPGRSLAGPGLARTAGEGGRGVLTHRAGAVRDFGAVTETPANRITPEALAMMYTRYAWAAGFCDDRAVLEVACGAGQGLGYLARRAKRVVGGDCTEDLLRVARRHYGGAMPLVRLDAHALPFGAASFDVVVLYEAIYYLAEPSRFFAECRRVLRPGGILLVCAVNREWPEFNPSPLSVRYPAAEELGRLLRAARFDVELRAAFPVPARSGRDALLGLVRRAAVALRVIPGSMRGKELLKRVFLGPLVAVPAEIGDGIAEFRPPVRLEPGVPAGGFKVLYAVAHVR